MKVRIPSVNPVLIMALILLPLASMPDIDVSLGPPGAKLFNFVMLALLGLYILKGGFLPRFHDKIQKIGVLVALVYIFIFIIAAIRTISNFGVLPQFSADLIGGGVSTFVLSFVVKPLLYFVPTIYVIRFVSNAKEIDQVIGWVVISSLVFSILVVQIGFTDLLSFAGVLGRVALTAKFQAELGLHYNSIASILVAVFPVSIYMFGRGERFYKLVFYAAPFVIFAAGMVTQSRTSVLLLVLSLLVLVIWGGGKSQLRKFAIGAIFVVGGLGIPFALTLMSVFFDTGGAGENKLDYVLSGRLESIWLPLASEVFSSLKTILIGLGLYGLLFTDVYYSPDFYQASHAHNAYLNLLIDSGIFVFIFIVYTYILILKKLYMFVKQDKQSPAKYIFVSLSMFLFAALSGRVFFPSQDNFWVLLLLGLSVSVIREHTYRKDSN